MRAHTLLNSCGFNTFVGFVNARVQISEDDIYGMSEATDSIMSQQKLALLCMLRKTKLKIICKIMHAIGKITQLNGASNSEESLKLVWSEYIHLF